MSETSSKPSFFFPLEMPTQFSWRKYENSVLFKLLKLWAKATVCVVVLPTILFVCVPLSILLIPPLFIASTWAFCMCKLLYFLCPLRVVDTMKFFRFFTTLILGGSSTASTSKASDNDDEGNKEEEMIAKSREDKEQPMSVVELDPSEVPCFYESDDHEQENKEEQNNVKEVKEEVGKTGMYEEGSWQVLVPKPPIPKRKKEKHTFHEVLSYWKSKEKGEAASAGTREEDYCSI
ncbi:hypothetical protein ACLB2K_034011 [Fragaria x ananassa]|uniref:uncharacterized protein LOC105351130 n=1 Tax=Fragaria vesca subsp. vesca TaxID=101020 RepID=UPI0005CA3FC5|nr:PREDICTED: uncharacterized protein LOC105351130 [Fragaria vesca subsp. vesca]